ncbi:hypothetical protein JTB14_022306 [Gonioctena quinquepunctata]|nr:hypothetical protein JTB14_022306 [Gonioctena quinquepunctata]
MGKIRGTWDEHHMKVTSKKVLTKGMSIREASQIYSVPKSSLADRLKSIRRIEEVIIKPNTNKGPQVKPIFSARPTTPINVLEEISPFSSRSSNIRFQKRKAREEESEILTSTPHEEQLEKQRRLAEEKKEHAAIKKRLREEMAKNKDEKGKRMKLEEDSKLEQVKTFSKFYDQLENTKKTTNCIVCR